MNYYNFHVGDYAAHTAHLNWEEDLIYRRLLDLYYLHERALQTDVQKLARVIRMPKSVASIEAVLDEFFQLRDDGWHNKRADAELIAMGEKQGLNEERNSHEKDRQKRYRERRSAMFEALRIVGVIPSWEVPMKDLQRLFEQHCNVASTSPETDLQRNGDVSGNGPATAIPIPTPTPTPEEKEPKGSSSAAKLPTCPTAELIDLYHEVLPEMPKVRLHTKDRVRALKRLWDWTLTSKRPDGSRRSESRDDSLAWFRLYFEQARENDFLMGRGKRSDEHANWRCDLDFLLTERGMKHVIEKTSRGQG